MSVDTLPQHPGSTTVRPEGLGRRQVHAVAACYVAASAAAPGLPPYLTAVPPALGDPQGRWAGVPCIVPTVFSAPGTPLRGRLADRFGRTRLLLRARLGLTVPFLRAGAADSLPACRLALVLQGFLLQGFLGGTFAATNGYPAAAARTRTAFLTRPRAGIALGFGFVALGLAGHAAAHSPAAFAALRLLLGAGLTLGLVCLSVPAAEATRGRAPGRMFGTAELLSKGGAVAAGAVAALADDRFGTAAPVLVGTAAALPAIAAAATLVLPTRTRWSNRR
ncbi:hypothetical protein ACWDRR_07910 [Kitasatospora sp. NPDC003701]